MLIYFMCGNQSIISVLLASTALFGFAAISKYRNKQQGFLNTLLYLLLLLLLLLMAFSKGRAGWIGFSAGLLHLTQRFRWLPQMSRRIAITVILPVLFCILLLLFKQNSTRGRVLIYKISYGIFNDHWAWGIGWEKFKQQYGLYQATYFSDHNIDSKEALLADNVFYAFNDGWQLLLELGVLKFAGLLSAVLVIFFLLKNIDWSQPAMNIRYGLEAGLLCLLVASLFGNPFHFFGARLLGLCYLLALLLLITPVCRKKMQHIVLNLCRLFLMIMIIWQCYCCCKKYKMIRMSSTAFMLLQAGYKKQALDLYRQVLESGLGQMPAMVQYARTLYLSGRTIEAKDLVIKLKEKFNNSDLVLLSARIEMELGNIKKAEEEFKTGVYMVPNRMKSRFDLLGFYCMKKDTIQIWRWSQSILEMPVKVPSAVTRSIRKQARLIRIQLIRNLEAKQ